MENCCWWGRGSLKITGTCLYGKLNYFLGANKAARDGRESALFPDVDFCRDPGEICAGVESIKLRWISGMYAFMENVQKYNEDGFSYNGKLLSFHQFNLHTTHCSNSILSFPAKMNSSNLSTTIWLIKLSSKWQPRFTLLGAILIVVQTVVLRIWTLVSVTSKRCCRHSVFNSVPMLLLNLRSRDFLVNLHRHHLQLSLARGPTQYHRLALLLHQLKRLSPK